MLSPEIWEILPPANQIKFDSGSLKEQSTHCSNLSDKHYYNHLVCVTLPGVQQVPKNIVSSLSEDCDYYLVKNVSVSELVNKQFINTFINKGQLTALSDGTWLDRDNCVAVTPSGHLLLYLQSETYQELGLEGKPSFFSQKKPKQFVVDLDLLAEHFVPGKKNYERVQWCLTDRIDLNFNLLVAWEPPEENVCPSSIAAYFASRGYTVSLCTPQFKMRNDQDVLVPLLEPSSDVESCSAAELVEWLGAYSIQANMVLEDEDTYLSSYQTPSRNKSFGQVANLQWSGFFTNKQIHKLFEDIRRFITANKNSPWASLYVQGFSDCPVSWGLKEHQYYTNGDNNFVIFVRPDEYYITCSILSSTKRPKCKLT